MEAPNRLLNRLMEIFGVEQDKELAKALSTSKQTISDLRAGRISAGLILKIHDACGLTVNEIRKLAGVTFTFTLRVQETTPEL